MVTFRVPAGPIGGDYTAIQLSTPVVMGPDTALSLRIRPSTIPMGAVLTFELRESPSGNPIASLGLTSLGVAIRYRDDTGLPIANVPFDASTGGLGLRFRQEKLERYRIA